MITINKDGVFRVIAIVAAAAAAVWVATSDAADFNPGVNGSKITNYDIHIAYERQENRAYEETEAGLDQAMQDLFVLSFANGAIIANMRSVAALCSPAYAHQLMPHGDGFRLADELAQIQIEDGFGNSTWSFTALDSMTFDCLRVHGILAGEALDVPAHASSDMVGESLLNWATGGPGQREGM